MSIIFYLTVHGYSFLYGCRSYRFQREGKLLIACFSPFTKSNTVCCSFSNPTFFVKFQNYCDCEKGIDLTTQSFYLFVQSIFSKPVDFVICCSPTKCEEHKLLRYLQLLACSFRQELRILYKEILLKAFQAQVCVKIISY